MHRPAVRRACALRQTLALPKATCSRKRKSGAFSLRSFRCVDKPDSVPFAYANMGNHLSSSSITLGVKRHSYCHAWSQQARPCTQVGILPLHPSTSLRASPLLIRRFILCRMPLPLGLGVSVRIPKLTLDGRYPLPCYTIPKNCVRVRTFLPATFATERLPHAEGNNIKIHPSLQHSLCVVTWIKEEQRGVHHASLDRRLV